MTDIQAIRERWADKYVLNGVGYGFSNPFMKDIESLLSEIDRLNAVVVGARDAALKDFGKYLDMHTGLHGGRKEAMHTLHLLDKFRALKSPASGGEAGE